MKKPKSNLFSNSELSWIIVNICVILTTIFLAPIIIFDEGLLIKVKVISTLFLFIIIVICYIDLRIIYNTIRKRKEKLDMINALCEKDNEK